MMRLLVLLLVVACAAPAQIVKEVRAALSGGDAAKAAALLDEFKQKQGVTSEYLEAYSWQARNALAAKNYEDAQRYAAETKRQALEVAKQGGVDKDKNLPIALGAAIEVEAQAAAARGERDQGVEYLRKELARYRSTSMRARIQKNLNLLSLEGKKALPLGVSLNGKPALVFLWAHWCGDCKSMAPVLARLKPELEAKGIRMIAPTQHYGYAERGRDVPPADESKHIEKVWREFYAGIGDAPHPVNTEIFQTWGASTTPTFVLIDRRGIVRLYHPGKLTYDDLIARVNEMLSS